MIFPTFLVYFPVLEWNWDALFHETKCQIMQKNAVLVSIYFIYLVLCFFKVKLYPQMGYKRVPVLFWLLAMTNGTNHKFKFDIGKHLQLCLVYDFELFMFFMVITCYKASFRLLVWHCPQKTNRKLSCTKTCQKIILLLSIHSWDAVELFFLIIILV